MIGTTKTEVSVLEGAVNLDPRSQTTARSIGSNLMRLAKNRPGASAVSCDDETLTWLDLHQRSNRIAHALSRLGVKHGDFVTIALPNSTGFIVVCYAIWKLGAIPQPVSWRLPEIELKSIVALAKSACIISEMPISADRPVYSVAALLSASDDISDLPDAVSPWWKAPTSGGSTGTPKLIVSGDPGIINEAASEFFRLGSDDTPLIPAPLYHNGPFSLGSLASQSGAHLVLMQKFDAEETLRLIEKHKVTWVYLVPTMMSRIWRLPEETRNRYDLSSLQTIWHMAAPCPPWLKKTWIDWLGAEKILEVYAGTEAQSMTLIDGTEWLSHPGSVGRVCMGEMKIFSPSGTELAPGEEGEIYMKWTNRATTPYNYIGASPRILPGGWESIGDIGWFDNDGYLYLADRRTDMILVGGSNVYPAEIEAALDEHPLVVSSAVIGLPDEDLGNRVHAIVQPRPGLDIDELKEHLAARLVTYKMPRSFELVSEPLRDDAGKVRRSDLRGARLNST